jgi:N6-adenosine-specific RNA methylase IME4/predicted transcriptional regulator
MNREDAEEYTQSLGQIVAGSWRQIELAHRLGVPRSLGFANTRQWVEDRLGGYVKLSITERIDAAKQLIEGGKSQREAADILGVTQATVSGDLKADKNLSERAETEPEIGNTSDDTDKNLSDLEQSRKREAVLREQLKVAQTPATALTKRYGTIVIDPPWPMKKIEREVRPNQVEFDYPTMDYEQLRAFRSTFQDFTADDCHVFMWTTQKFLPMALRLFEDYGVKYVLTMVWHKPGGFQPIGLPQYNCEFVLYGRIGSPDFSDTKAFNCCFNAPRAEHSRKPDAFYDLVRRVTAGERLDIFSREARDGFDQFGNETGKFSEAAE